MAFNRHPLLAIERHLYAHFPLKTPNEGFIRRQSVKTF